MDGNDNDDSNDDSTVVILLGQLGRCGACEELNKRSSDGPARVATRAYRSNYDAIFGKPREKQYVN